MEPKILKTHIVPPPPHMRKALAHSGYTLESAIADVMDNCVSANAKNITLTISILEGEFHLTILDDGDGMTEQKLGEAMVYGYKDFEDGRALTDIGRYSIGLKSASSSFCTDLLVYSKAKGCGVFGATQSFNSDFWGYSDIAPQGNEIPTPSGTLVVWNHAKFEKDPDANQALLNSRDLLANLVTRVKIYLSKAFCLFMTGENPLSIIVNGQRLSGWSPVDGCDGISSNYKETIPVNGSTITVQTYTLPPFTKMTPKEQTYVCLGHNGKIQETQGFYVYRQNRLIIAGGWLGIEGLDNNNKSQYARIILHFDNTLDDYMSVNFEKNSIKIPEDLAQRLKIVAKRARVDSLHQYDYQRDPRPYRHKKSSDQIPVWSVTRSGTTVRVDVNPENPLVSGYTATMSEKDKKAFFSLLSKTYPISEFSGAAPAINELSNEELKEMVERRCEELKGKVATDQIAPTLLKEEPFCDSKYQSLSKSILLDLLMNDKG